MRKGQHLSDDMLVSLLDGPPPQPTRVRIAAQQHLSSCEPCSGRFELFRQFTALIGQTDVWHLHGLKSRPSRHWSRHVAALSKKLRDEDAQAAALVDQLITGPRSWWKVRIVKSGKASTYGMVEQLLSRADAIVYAAPGDALELTSIAAQIADDLRIDAYPFDLVVSLRARARRDHAFCLFYLGRFPEALAAIDCSEQLFRQLPIHAFDLARTSLVRALIYRSTDRVAEAVPLTREAGDTFRTFGDRERYAKARMTEGAMLFHMGRIAEALDVWKLLEHEPAIMDTPSFGGLLQNIGTCHRQTGDFDRARDYYARAIAHHERHEALAEMVRTRWSLGATLVAAGQFHEALPVLRLTWKEFDEMAMETDAALVGLEVAEVLLIVEQPDEVPAICRTLLDRFTSNNMTSRAITALSFLREAVALGKATPSLVRHVHDFLRDIPEHPSSRPIPPPPM